MQCQNKHIGCAMPEQRRTRWQRALELWRRPGLVRAASGLIGYATRHKSRDSLADVVGLMLEQRALAIAAKQEQWAGTQWWRAET